MIWIHHFPIQWLYTDMLYSVFPNNVTYDLEDLLCTEEEVLHLLQRLNIEKANGFEC